MLNPENSSFVSNDTVKSSALKSRDQLRAPATRKVSCSPVYFGPQKTPLFGNLFLSAAGTWHDAILICPPVGHEYSRCAAVINKLANSLAASGHTVLVFDYFGTGDSSGSFENVGLDRWQDDVRTAAQYLRQHANAKSVKLLGIRMGALIAVSTDLERVNLVSLWDPVVSAQDWFSIQTTLQAKALRSTSRFMWHKPIARKDNVKQLFGHQFTTSLIGELSELRLDLTKLGAIKKNTVLTRAAHYYTKPKPAGDTIAGDSLLKTYNSTFDCHWSDSTELEKTIPTRGLDVDNLLANLELSLGHGTH